MVSLIEVAVKLFHSVGLASLFCSVVLMVLTFVNINFMGYFMANESNLALSLTELVVSVFAAFYWGFIAIRLIKKTRTIT
jgi:hypothetical protein